MLHSTNQTIKEATEYNRMPAEFVHLHNHSDFSLLDGLSSPSDLAKCASELGYKSLALTDHGSCGGLLKFQKACHEVGIKPILGMEGYVCKDHTDTSDKKQSSNHIVLLAKNEAGYKNLIRLSSIGYLEGFYYRPRIDFGLLQKHREGLIVSSACIAGEIPQAILRDDIKTAEKIASDYRDVFGDDFYLEIMTHIYQGDSDQQQREIDVSKEVYRMASRLGIKAICTQDVHYARKEDAKVHDLMLAMQTGTHVKNPKRMTFRSDDFYLKAAIEMAAKYKNSPELLKNTLEIAEKIEDGVLKTGQNLSPNFDLPPEFSTGEEYLKALVQDGMKQKGFINKQEYRDRIKYEMSVIIDCGYVMYFLILWDIINFARTNGIRLGIGRGSAVSSLCLYVLGITKIDPLKYDLIFERFLNPDRISPPDVDVDFDYYRRQEVYNYIIRTYGADFCSQIGVYQTLKARAAIRRVGKAMDIGRDWEVTKKLERTNPGQKIDPPKNTQNISDFVAKLVPHKITKLEEALHESEELREATAKYPGLVENVIRFEKKPVSFGVHPAGVLVSRERPIDVIPLRVSKGVVSSQFDGPEVEEVGLIKYDILALKTLTVIERTVQMIKERHGIEVNVDTLEPNDPKVFALLNGEIRGVDTKGVFQFEGYRIAELLSNIHVDSFEDMIVTNALYRPGPLNAGLHTDYSDFKHGRRDIEYLHPKMGEVLDDTYGIMVYQESLMRVAQHLAGFTAAQADTLRKVVGKKKPELIKKEKLDTLFVQGCVDNGVPATTAKEIFAQIYKFADYGFNKSHSCAYAFLAYQTAWLKKYYPIEFMCNLLTSEIDNNDKDEKLTGYVQAANMMGIKTIGHDINLSKDVFIIDKDRSGKEVLRFPLNTLKGLGPKAVEDVLANQPYRDLDYFLRTVDLRKVNSKAMKALIESDCMKEAWGMSAPRLLSEYESKKKILDKERTKAKRQEKKMEGYDEALPTEFLGSYNEVVL